jgi:hypothetical protein
MGCQVRLATSEDAAAISRVVIAALRQSNSQDYSPDVIAQVERSFASAVPVRPAGFCLPRGDRKTAAGVSHAANFNWPTESNQRYSEY